MFKLKNKLLTISQVAVLLGLVNIKNKKPLTHTLRFWETKFKQLRPTTLSGGRRYYSAKDVEVAKMIFFLLKNKGLTINGAKKTMNENLKKLDGSNSYSIKLDYYKKIITHKTKNILKKIKKLNGEKNTY